MLIKQAVYCYRTKPTSHKALWITEAILVFLVLWCFSQPLMSTWLLSERSYLLLRLVAFTCMYENTLSLVSSILVFFPVLDLFVTAVRMTDLNSSVAALGD